MQDGHAVLLNLVKCIQWQYIVMELGQVLLNSIFIIIDIYALEEEKKTSIRNGQLKYGKNGVALRYGGHFNM